MRFIRILSACLGIFLASATSCFLLLYWYSIKTIPSAETLHQSARLSIPMEIYTSDGELMARFGTEFRLPVTYAELPQRLVSIFLATEDRRFYEHRGVDPIGIFRAFIIFLETHKRQQGASTITQQLARNLFLSSEKTFSRKIKEIALALRIEGLISKEDILTLYLNKIYLGHRAYGIAAAAKTYFDKPLHALSISESALLAALPKAPSALDPLRFPERALVRRDLLLNMMFETALISQKEFEEALASPLGLAPSKQKPRRQIAPYAAEQVRIALFREYQAACYTDGLRVVTSIDSKLQAAAEEAVYSAVMRYDRRHGYRGPIRQLWNPETEEPWSIDRIRSYLKSQPTALNHRLVPAVVISVGEKTSEVVSASDEHIILNWEAMAWARSYLADSKQGAIPQSAGEILRVGDCIYIEADGKEWLLAQPPEVNAAFVSLHPRTGAIQALVGGIDFQNSQFNRVTQAQRQLGSVIKPLIYAAAFERGLTLATLLNDLPITRWSFDTESVWQPNNSPPVYAGPLRIRVGIGQSKNVMAVRAVRAAGLKYVAEYLTTRFGLNKEYVLPNEALALGAPTCTPLALARAYAVISNGGYLITPQLIQRIETADGRVIKSYPPHLVPEQPTPVCYKAPKPINHQQMSMLEIALPADQVTTPPESTATEAVFQPNLEYLQEQTNPTYAPHVLSEEIAFLVKESLVSAIYGEVGLNWLPTGWRGRMLKRRDVGGKSGTTNDSKDAWFAGVTPEHVPVMWLGFDDYKRTLGEVTHCPGSKCSISGGESGAKTAQPAWNRFVRDALKTIPETLPKVPSRIRTSYIDPSSGERVAADHPSALLEYFVEGTIPKNQASPSHRLSEERRLAAERDLFN